MDGSFSKAAIIAWNGSREPFGISSSASIRRSSVRISARSLRLETDASDLSADRITFGCRYTSSLRMNVRISSSSVSQSMTTNRASSSSSRISIRSSSSSPNSVASLRTRSGMTPVYSTSGWHRIDS